MTHYTRALDKIYTELNMAKKVPKVVQKMRREYHDNPHDFYLLVCRKYGVTPEKRFDADLLVYGRTKHKKWKFEQDADNERVGEMKDRETEIKAEEDTAIVKVQDSEFTEKLETTEVEEKKEDKPKPNLFVDASREILGQSPRRAKVVERMYMPQASRDERRVSPRTSPRRVAMQRIEYVNIYPGDICETMVLTEADKDQETGFWVPARVLSIDTEKETMNLEVLQPVKYGLSQLAQNVPYRYVRAPAEIIWQQ